MDRGKSRKVREAIADLFWHGVWRLQGMRRCPRCHLTWEPPAVMARQGGYCHDCEASDVVDEMNWESRERLRTAVEGMLNAADYYPPEVMNEPDGAWRLGGSAKEAWRIGIQQLREARDA